MTRLAQLTFALLVCATLAAFFVTQRLKRSPLVVRQRTVTTAFSPNGDGIRERASIRFSLKRSDDVTVSIVDREGSVVRRLAEDRRLPGGRPLQFVWNGRNDHHRVVPDGWRGTRRRRTGPDPFPRASGRLAPGRVSVQA